MKCINLREKEGFNKMWILQTKDTNLPEWLASNLNSKCKCGGDMENYYNERQQITNRRCNNPKCPFMLAQRIVTACDLFKIDGVGPERACTLINERNLSSVYEALPVLLGRTPEVPLGTFLRLAFIPGYASKWDTVADGYTSLEECLQKYDGPLGGVLREHADEFREGLKYVKVLVPENQAFKCIYRCTVMISGAIRGFKERNNFIYAINKACKGLVQISVAEGRRKTGVVALIQEADSPNRGKAECALENGIPIMTPNEFTSFIKVRLNERMGTNRGFNS